MADRCLTLRPMPPSSRAGSLDVVEPDVEVGPVLVLVQGWLVATAVLLAVFVLLVTVQGTTRQLRRAVSALGGRSASPASPQLVTSRS